MMMLWWCFIFTVLWASKAELGTWHCGPGPVFHSEFIAWSRERLGAAQAAVTSVTSRSGCFFHLSKSKMFDSIEYWGIWWRWWRSEINFKTLPRWTLLEAVICAFSQQPVCDPEWQKFLDAESGEIFQSAQLLRLWVSLGDVCQGT